MIPVIHTVDIAAIQGGKILLIKLAKQPFMNKLVLPGGHVDAEDLDLKHAACRELGEETNLPFKVADLEFLMILDAPYRDPRTDARRISTCFVAEVPMNFSLDQCRAGDDARETVVCHIDSLKEPDIGFDHWLVVRQLQRRKESAETMWRRSQQNGYPYSHDCPAHTEFGACQVRVVWDQDKNSAALKCHESFCLTKIKICPFCGIRLTDPAALL